jgi:MOSC domain-containing protein YiiM
MKVLSVNVGLPRRVLFNGQTVITGIFKDPVKRPVMLRKLNLDGDRQADLTVHGGVDKAVYSYPKEHYYYWSNQFPDLDFVWGMFGENFTTEGLMEENVNIGDHFQIGYAKLVATQPRMPCYKLGIKFGTMEIIRRFLSSGRSGIYFKVLEEGKVQPDDEIKIIKRDKDKVTIKDIVSLYNSNDIEHNIKTMKRAMKVKALPEGWRYDFQQNIEQFEQSRSLA